MSETASSRRVDDFDEHRAAATETERERRGAQSRKPKYSSAAKGSKALTFFRACEWRDLNPDIWERWERIALEEAAHGRRFSMQFVTEQARKQDRVDWNGEPVKVNNTYRPIWARMLATEHPELMPFTELRRSEWDADFPSLGRGEVSR